MSKVLQKELEQILLERLEQKVDLSAEPDKLELIRDGLQAVVASITDELVQGGEVKLYGFGRFWVCDVQAENRDPRTNEHLGVASFKNVIFSPSVQQVVKHGS